MSNPIQANIAQVIDNQTVAISAGKNAGIKVGMRFKIFSKSKVSINDPFTHEPLGELDIEKLRVEVTSVYEKFCIAETYKYETINEGGTYTGTSFITLSKMFEEPKLVKKRETFEIDPNGKKPISEVDSVVRVGDRVEQIIPLKISE